MDSQDASLIEDMKELTYVSQEQTQSSSPKLLHEKLQNLASRVLHPTAPSHDSERKEDKIFVFQDESVFQDRSKSRKYGSRSPQKKTKKVAGLVVDSHIHSHACSRSETSVAKIQSTSSTAIFTDGKISEGETGKRHPALSAAQMIRMLQQISSERTNLLQRLQNLQEEEESILAMIAQSKFIQSVAPLENNNQSRPAQGVVKDKIWTRLAEGKSDLRFETSSDMRHKSPMMKPLFAPPQFTPSANRNFRQTPSRKRVPLGDKTDVSIETNISASGAILSEPASLLNTSNRADEIMRQFSHEQSFSMRVPMKFADVDASATNNNKELKTPKESVKEKTSAPAHQHDTSKSFVVPATVNRKRW
ncbi:hypothetical protein B0J11DRAFT_565886 [Dendryphion nanum]|uniref:Uncharacterized protein n=1 Tax=Dendryphion nanum TaxID=256645 RepID=A0A9P9IVB0_9PLEO|nr:hypothetical protein B0J11DRAFT_565886 [Dendryphion nanum]